MAIVDEYFWRQFDDIDHRRRLHQRRREEALRRMSPASASPGDPDARAAWRSYCESVERLEQCVIELEQLIWRSC
jgi:hypothetical protein